MKNLFENAKFGDRYKLRDGRMAIYLSTYYGGSENDKENPPFIDVDFAVEVHIIYVDGSEKRFHRIDQYDGATGKFNKWATEEDDWDIVGKWEEPIDEEKLDKLAQNAYPFEDDAHWNGYQRERQEAYKAGYRKAKEE